MFVAEFVSVTDAFGTTAPDSSRTVPLTVAVLACGHTGGASNASMRRDKATLHQHLRFMLSPLTYLIPSCPESHSGLAIGSSVHLSRSFGPGETTVRRSG